jgi:hypothetical protein
MTWEELLKNRTLAPTLRHSGHMLECRAAVLAKFPNAKIVEDGEDLWKLMDGDKDLSNPHNSHYACWSEARDIMEMMT